MAQTKMPEKSEHLSPDTTNMHRALNSLIEELEAIDWYSQRIDACSDDSLKKILRHNSNEEKEHASMLLEWIRRNDKDFERELKDYLFTEKEISD